MALVLRVLLFLLPLVAFVTFLKYRLSSDKSEAALAAETERLKRRLIFIAALFLLAVVALNIVTTRGTPAECYIPPKTVDGKIVKGRYVPNDDPACIAEKKRKMQRKPADT